MAKVFNPLHSEDVRGKVGGIVFSRSKQGPTVRLRVNPSQPQTADQMLVRGYLATASAAWASLTTQQRDSWDTYAGLHPVSNVFGETTYLSGHQYYCRCACILLALGKSVPTTAPAVAAPTNVANIVATPGSGQVSIAFTAKPGTNLSVACDLFGPHSAGINVKQAMCNLNGYHPAETTPWVITGLAAGLHTAFIYVASEDTGLLSTATKISFTVP